MSVNLWLSEVLSLRPFRRISRRRSLVKVEPADVLECRQMLSATNILAFGSIDVDSSTDLTLSSHFDDPDIEGSTVRIETPVGSFFIETYDRITPVTAQNFIDLASAGNYEDMFLHRSVDDFVVQGGGFTFPEGATAPDSVANNGTIVNEFANWFDSELGGLDEGTPLNLRGTVAMAKVGGNPDSATSQWFVSLADNSEILDPQNGGFTVFAHVLYDGMDTVDIIGALDRVNAGGAYAELPVRGEIGNNILRENLITTTTTVVPELTYAITENSAPGVLAASIVDGVLKLEPVVGQAGSVAITVSATDLEGNTVSDVVDVTVGLSTKLTTPVGSGQPVRPEFTWPAVSGASHYELWVNQVGGQNAIVRETNIQGTSFTPPSDLPGGSYIAWVRWHDSDTAGKWGQAQKFSINALTAVEITSPDTRTISDKRPVIEWTASDGASAYDVWINQVGIQNQIIRQEVTSTSFMPSEDLAEGTYRVWVQATADDQESEWSSAVTFDIATGLTITSPSSVATTERPEITWTGDSTGVYELWVNAVGGTTRIVHNAAISGTTFTPDTDLADGSYRAWVRERPTSGVPGPWSPAFDFSVAASGLPSKPAISDVTNTATLRPTFSWTAVDNAASYELWVNNRSTGESRVIHQASITDLSFIATSDLATGDYRVWLRGFSSSLIPGPWSDPFDFTV